MGFTIRTYVLCSFSAMLLLLSIVAGVALDRTKQIGLIAGDLNSRVIDKTNIAAKIVDLGQQIRFVDAFLSIASDPDEVALAQRMIRDRVDSIDAQTANYLHYVDSPLERSLLLNLQRSRTAYLKLQQDVLDTSLADHRKNMATNEQRLADAFDQANRQARGLSHIAEVQALSERDQAVAITRNAQSLVLVVASFAVAIGVLILFILLGGVFRPLKQITKSLIALSEGRLDVSLFPSGRGGEIDAMAQAMDVFRRNALALSEAHEETKTAHERADLLARHDALTGLPNRRFLAFSIDNAIRRSQRSGLACAVLLLDLDRFKPVNDIYGHGAGDRVLCEVANRLGTTLRSGETAARIGGDEFAVVIEYELGSDAPHRVAKRIMASIAEPINLESRSVTVGTSIGIAIWPSDGRDADSLLHAADLAMFKAKRDKGSGFSFFEAEMDLQLRARADLEARICAAIDHGDIRPHYQPLVNLQSNVITGFEVLARWHDGAVFRPPSEFISVVEDAGLIPEMTSSVLRHACREARLWPNSLTLALNITPTQISDIRLPSILLKILEEEDFSPSRLELEITENALIGDISTAKIVMATLRDHGVSISLDDFGTGYSSLHHLRDLKFDKIKIDRSFVQSMLSNDESLKIVETVLGLGRSLGILTIAEGIEDEANLKSLVDLGCQFGQGYHFGKPIAGDRVVEMLVGHGEMRQPLNVAA